MYVFTLVMHFTHNWVINEFKQPKKSEEPLAVERAGSFFVSRAKRTGSLNGAGIPITGTNTHRGKHIYSGVEQFCDFILVFLV